MTTHTLKLVHCFAIFLVVASLGIGKAVPRDITFYGLDQDIRLFKLAVVSIERISEKGDTVSLGSGCLINIATVTPILTCFHIVANLTSSDSLVVALNSMEGKTYYPVHGIYANKALDLALLFLHAHDEEDYVQESKVDQIVIGRSIFAKNTDIKEGLGVLVIGFPLGLGTGVVHNYAISRIGIIAQVIPDEPVFLIDGIASHGNSGSPVFLCGVSSNKPTKFLGIVKGFPAERINAFDENGNLIVSLPYNSGLTFCIPAYTIKEFLSNAEQHIE